LPPLTTTLARRMLERTAIYRALQGTRGKRPVDLGALESLLVMFSRMVVDHPAIREVDINPLLASAERLLALDARVVLHPADVPEEQLPRPAIRPYPNQYVTSRRLEDGTEVVLRPIRPEDEPLLARFHETLSDRTVYLRYLQRMKLDERVHHARLARICFIDYAREMVLVAETGRGAERVVVGVGRLNSTHERDEAQFSLLLSDTYQGRGLGSAFLETLLDVGRREGLRRVTAEIAAENAAMQAVCRKLGFQLVAEPDGATVRAAVTL
jgi:acetyltransferase